MRDWTNKKQILLTTAPHVTKFHPGKSAKYPKLEDDLFAWVREKRANGYAVSQKLITNKTVSLSRNKRIYS